MTPPSWTKTLRWLTGRRKMLDIGINKSNSSITYFWIKTRIDLWTNKSGRHRRYSDKWGDSSKQEELISVEVTIKKWKSSIRSLMTFCSSFRAVVNKFQQMLWKWKSMRTTQPVSTLFTKTWLNFQWLMKKSSIKYLSCLSTLCMRWKGLTSNPFLWWTFSFLSALNFPSTTDNSYLIFV